MAASGSSHFDQGFAAATFGEEMDEMDVVLLRSPLEIAGGKTSAILLSFAQGEDFGALVYGRFQGDYKKAVSALKLAPTGRVDGRAWDNSREPWRSMSTATPTRSAR